MANETTPKKKYYDNKPKKALKLCINCKTGKEVFGEALCIKFGKINTLNHTCHCWKKRD